MILVSHKLDIRRNRAIYLPYFVENTNASFRMFFFLRSLQMPRGYGLQIMFQAELAQGLPQVMADRVQLQQVLMNLMINGIDAMKDVDGVRELTINARWTKKEQVSVSDTGVGLPPQQADQTTVPVVRKAGLQYRPLQRGVFSSELGISGGVMAAKHGIKLVLLLALLAGVASAQDAKTAIQNAQKAMGDVKSIRYSGTGKAGGLGQNWNPTTTWHPTVITNYTRTIDYASRSSREELTRVQENPPARGGEAPFDGEQKQVNLVSGQYAWNQPGNAPQPAIAAADERQLQIWLTPHGFLSAAAENNALTKTGKESGKKVSVLSFMIGKNKVTGDIDDQNLVTKVDTWIPHPVLGDMLVETTYSDYKDFNGIKFPTHIVQKEGGFATLDLTVTNAQANVQNASLQVPDAVRQATAPPVRVVSQKMADGVWFLGGGTHNSVLIEFKDYVAVVEAPNNEARSDAVIAEVKRLVPAKPIKYLINTHHHFDHSGGVRTYVAAGATIITNEGNKALYEQAWNQPRTLDPDRLSQNPRKATFITFKDKYVLTDGNRSLELYKTQRDNHNEFLTFGYLPKEKILIEADDFTPPAPNGPAPVPIALAFGNNLYDNLQRLKIDVVAIAPLHGNVSSMSEMRKVLGKSS